MIEPYYLSLRAKMGDDRCLRLALSTHGYYKIEYELYYLSFMVQISVTC